MSIEAEFTEDIRGNCDICLGDECGPSGVRVQGTPVAVGRGCLERMFLALPKPIVVSADAASDALARLERAAFPGDPTEPPRAEPPPSARRTQRKRSRALASGRAGAAA